MTRTTRKEGYWMRHDPVWYRRGLNRSFRRQVQQYFLKFGEILLVNPKKNTGWWH